MQTSQQPIHHEVTHYYQPTMSSCSQTSLAILLSYYNDVVAPEEIMQSVPVNKDDKGEDWGTINQNLATWCLSRGYTVTMHTADFQIIDTSWAGKPTSFILQRLKLARGNRDVPSLGPGYSEQYVESYIDYIEQGGTLHVERYMTEALLDRCLKNGPLLLCICFAVLYGVGRIINDTLRDYHTDDIAGNTGNHSVVLYGKDDAGNYMIADPWQKPGRHTFKPDDVLAAMAASQIECDNLFFQLGK